MIRRLPPLLKTLREGMAEAGLTVEKQDEQIKALNPRMIYASLTAYGEHGPDRGKEGFQCRKAPGGPLVAKLEVPVTGGWETWTEITAPLVRPENPHADLYLVFINPGKSGLMNVDWVEFGQ